MAAVTSEGTGTAFAVKFATSSGTFETSFPVRSDGPPAKTKPPAMMTAIATPRRTLSKVDVGALTIIVCCGAGIASDAGTGSDAAALCVCGMVGACAVSDDAVDAFA